MLSLFDTASGRVRPLALREAGHLGMYVCGPTVDGPPHLGHGRSILVYDILRRYASYRGLVVTHVSNITDVDDKIITKATSEGTSVQEVARRYEDEWWDAADRLGALRPTAVPHATAYIEAMKDLVAEMLASGAAYTTADGIYLDTSVVPDYGVLASQDPTTMLAGARVAALAAKRSPSDFVLWKFAKPTEPAWPAPFGAGRPGWHTECVAMSLDLLGEDFDLHTGGMDLAFPHHENERAQAVALGRGFAGHWMHHAFITAGGEKMSKSLGNFTTLPELLAGTDPRAYRLLVLRSHYRQPLEVTRDTLSQVAEALDRLDAFHERFAQSHPLVGGDKELVGEFCRFMDDDLDTPRATALVFEAVRDANGAADRGDFDRAAALAGAVEEVLGAVGLVLKDRTEAVPPPIAALVEARERARLERDFALADRLRAELLEQGWAVKDTPGGPRANRA